MQTEIISLKNVSLEVPVSDDRKFDPRLSPVRILKNSYIGQSRRGSLQILSNVNMSILSGQRVAVLGHNGAGKTSLLRLIAGNIKPSSGDISVQGKTHSLFNIQLGMNPQGTGIENIFLRGLQFGLSMKQIRSKLDDALAFAELGDNIHRKFATYSTGMKLRLAIAITLMPNPEILIMDEWIGAGDKSFASKLSASLDAYINESRGLIIATHNLNLVRRVCSHGILLYKGEPVYIGEIEDVLQNKQLHEKRLEKINND